MHQSVPETKEVAIRTLDAEIQALTKHLCQLKSQRNAFTASYTIPAEVLGEILLIVQANCKRPGVLLLSENFFSKFREWLPISHVSHHWRKVALGCSQLWCEIDVLPESAVWEFLVRSKGQNLFVDFIRNLPSGGRFHYPKDLFVNILSQTFRIQKLSIVSKKQFRRALPHIVPTPAPKLKELSIHGSVGLGGGIQLPDDLFHGITPQLHVLSLARCQLSPNSSLFMDGLTTLDVFECQVGSTLVWLNIIKRMPHLSRLALGLSFTDEADASRGLHNPIPRDFQVISLPQLRQLDIQGTWLKSDLDFLAHITFPSQTSVKFASSLSRTQPNPDELVEFSLNAFLRVHRQSRLNPSEMQIHSVKMEELPDFLDGPDGIPALSRNIKLSLQGESQNYLDVFLQRLSRVGWEPAQLAEIASLPISTATSFTINLNLDAPQETWNALSGWLPNLREINLFGVAIEPFLLAIGGSYTDPPLVFIDDYDEEDPILSSPPQLFEHLTTIHLTQVETHRIETLLRTAFKARLAHGVPISELRFSYCGVRDELVSYLQEQDLVEKVDCHQCNLGNEDEPTEWTVNVRDYVASEDSDEMEM